MSLPISFHIAGRRAVLVGGGSAALRKAAALLEAGASLRVVAPEICAELRELLARAGAQAIERPYEAADLDGAVFAVAATGADEVNACVVADARARGVLVCDAANPQRGDATMQAVVRVGDLTFSVDTGGASPSFAQRIARELRERFGEGYAMAAKTLARMRVYVKTVLPAAQRAGVMRALAELPIERLATMTPTDAEHEVESAIERLRGDAHAQPTRSVICASRASALAMTQTRIVAARLARAGVATSILNVTTTGDRVQDRSLVSIGAESLFVKELELALRERRADYAVHSCKDLPSTLPEDLHLAAICTREDPRDAFCSERYEDFWILPPGSRVGTSSLRRQAQLAALRPDLTYADIRGNVDTRLRKLREGDYDAIVLALAGLRRLGIGARYTVPFPVEQLVPAVGQGALAVETRAGDWLERVLRDALNDAPAELAVRCERAALRTLQGGCQAPIGIHATLSGEQLEVHGTVASLDGTRLVAARHAAAVREVEEAQAAGEELAALLLARGAQAILDECPRPATRPLAGRLVVLPRTQERPSRIAAALRTDGAEVLEVRAGEDLQDALARRVPDMIVFPSSGSVQAAAQYLLEVRRLDRRPAIAAMGPASSAAAHAAGFVPDVVAPDAEIDALVGAVREHFMERTGL